LRAIAPREALQRGFELVHLEVKLAELMVHRGVLRPLLDQFLQQQLRQKVLLRGHQAWTRLVREGQWPGLSVSA